MDDFLGKKKDTGPVMDMSKASVASKDDFKKVLDRVPDFKIKPEKVRPEDVKFRDKFTFKSGKKDLKTMRAPYTFMDPIPAEMANLKIDELASVAIDWRMLTNLRPKSKVDEEFFSRLVQLAKLELKTIDRDKKDLLNDPQIRKSKNKAGVIETRNVTCPDCGEDFCTGKQCAKIAYEAFVRVDVQAKITKKTTVQGKEHKKRKKTKRKSRSKSKSRRSKSKSPKKDNK